MATTNQADRLAYTPGAATPMVKRVAARLWGARGFFGGLLALALAWMGQMALVLPDYDGVALRYYLAATVVLIASLLHPSIPRVGPRTKVTQAPLPAEESVSHPADKPIRTRRAPLRRPSSPVLGARWSAMRARLGWRATAAGLALTLALAGLSAFALVGNVADPLGGWLWAGSLLALFITVAGAQPGQPAVGLLPGPESDFFAPGLPRVPLRWEAVIAAAIMIVALGLRVYNLEYLPGIFGDEGEQGLEVRAILEGATPSFFGTGWWGVPNLSFYAWSVVVSIFGDTVFGLRMFSVISGMVAVWYAYRTGRLMWGPRAGLLAGAMLAVSPLALQSSRFANVSSESMALWTVGAYYFFLALRYRRLSDWALSGFFWSLNLYFYPAGKLVIPMAAAMILYCLVRWRLDFSRRYALGIVLFGLAFGITFMPHAIFSAGDNWANFLGRANETSIFSPENHFRAFDRYLIPYDSRYADLSMLENIRYAPLVWGRVLYEQARESLLVLNARGDPTGYYSQNEHKGSVFSPPWAVLALLGLAYATWKVWDPRYGLVLIWFWFGMLGTILTIDPPNLQRILGGWPAAILFPAVLADRLAAAAWPLSLNLARRWLAATLALLLVALGVTSYNEYFVSYAATCPWCASTVQARYAQALGQEYKAYMMAGGGYPRYFGYGSTRFAARGVEGEDAFLPLDYLPVVDPKGRGAAFMVFAENLDYLPILRLYYPGGKEEAVKGGDGSQQFVSYKVTREQIAAAQVSLATYNWAGGSPVTRQEPGLGTSHSSGEWQPPEGARYPAQASWEGGLVAPSYGTYAFSLKGKNLKLVIDGREVASGSGSSIAPVNVVLARGLHEVRLSGDLTGPSDAIKLLWGTDGSATAPVPPLYLFRGPLGGLSVEFGPVPEEEQARLEPLNPETVFERRSYPAAALRDASQMFGGASFAARWQGTLRAPRDGVYTFLIAASGPAVVLIDGREVATNVSTSNPGVSGTNPSGDTVQLSAGPHEVDIRYTWPGGGGPATLEWSWSPPDQARSLVPPIVLSPRARSWLPAEIPAVPSARVQTGSPADPAAVLKPLLTFGMGELDRPRGIGVDAQGNVYVGDRNRGRIVVYSPEGKRLRKWGRLLQGEAAAALPGELGEIRDLDVAADGTVYVFDSTGRLQVFSSEGKVLRVVDTNPFATYGPTGIAVGPDGSIYIADTGISRLLKLAPSNDGQPFSQLQGKANGTETAGLDQPVDVAVAAEDASILFAADLKDRIVQISPGDAITSSWPMLVGRDEGGSRLAADADGARVYATDPERNRIAVLDTKSGDLSYFGAAGTGPGQFTTPTGVAVGSTGLLYVVDNSGRVQVFAMPRVDPE